jgi:hypothetical protein
MLPWAAVSRVPGISCSRLPGWVQNVDYGQTDDIPVHLRRLVALRDQGCQHPGGYFL